MPRPIDVIKAMNKLALDSKVKAIFGTEDGELIALDEHTVIVYRTQYMRVDGNIGKVTTFYSPVYSFPVGVEEIEFLDGVDISLKNGETLSLSKHTESELPDYYNRIYNVLYMIGTAKETNRNFMTSASAISMMAKVFGKDEVQVSWLISEKEDFGFLKLENTDKDLVIYTTCTSFD